MDTISLTTIQQALTLFFVLTGGLLLLNLVRAILEVAGFFRRKPPIDETIAAIVREFNNQLQDKVSLRDFTACDARHCQQIREMEARVTAVAKEQETRTRAEIRSMDERVDGRFAGLHSSLVEVRTTLQNSMADVLKEIGWLRGKDAAEGGPAR